MTTPDSPLALTNEDLHALVDGQLEPERLSEVWDRLRQHPELMSQVAQWQQQRLQLRRLHRQTAVGETPQAMLDAVRRAGARARWSPAALAGIIAGAVLLLSLGAVGEREWAARTGDGRGTGGSAATAGPAFVRDASIAYAVYVPEVKHPVEVTGDDEAQLVKWLTRRLGVALKAPSLGTEGFHLLGGRLLPGAQAAAKGGGPRAQFMYEDAQGRRVTLYVTVLDGAAPAETAFRSVREGGIESFYWLDGHLGYAFSAELAHAEAMALARDVYRQLSP